MPSTPCPACRWVAAPPSKIRRWEAPPQEVELERGREVVYKGAPCWLVKLRGYDTPEAVGALCGYRLLVPVCDRPPLQEPDEYYVQDLVGLHVVLHGSGSPAGTVADVFDGTGTHDVLRVDVPGGSHFLLPFAKELVPVVDLDAGVMRITPPEGLMDLGNASVEMDGSEEVEARSPRRRRRPRQSPGIPPAPAPPQ